MPIYCSMSFSVITLARGDGETDEQQTSLLQDNYSSDEGSPNRRYGSHQINTPLCLIEAECPTQQPARHAFTHPTSIWHSRSTGGRYLSLSPPRMGIFEDVWLTEDMERNQKHKMTLSLTLKDCIFSWQRKYENVPETCTYYQLTNVNSVNKVCFLVFFM